jgi:hypothetical protein
MLQDGLMSKPVKLILIGTGLVLTLGFIYEVLAWSDIIFNLGD